MSSWPTVRLGEICSDGIETRDPRRQPEMSFTYVDISSVDNREKQIVGSQGLLGQDAPSRARQIIRANDVLVATTRPNLNAVALVPPELDGAICSTGFCVLRASDRLDPHYLFAFVQAPHFVGSITDLVKGALYPAVTDRQILDQSIPLPSLEVQCKVAAQVDEARSAIARARAAAQERVRATAVLRAAYVRATFEGAEAAAWPRKSLGETCEFLDRRRVPVNEVERRRRIAGKTQSELYPYYGANGQVGWIDNFLFDEPLVLLAEDGGAFGSAMEPIAYAVSGRYWVNNHAHVLKPLAGVDLWFLLYAIMYRPDVGALTGGSTRPKLNQQAAARITIPVPPVADQRESVARLQGQLQTVSTLSRGAAQELTTIDALPAALLRRVFGGAVVNAEEPSTSA